MSPTSRCYQHHCHLWITLFLVMHLGDEMYWWQVWDVGHRFETLTKITNAKSWQYKDSVTKILNRLPWLSHQHDNVTKITVSDNLSPWMLDQESTDQNKSAYKDPRNQRSEWTRAKMKISDRDKNFESLGSFRIDSEQFVDPCIRSDLDES